MKLKPAYKMKKAEILNELKEVYDCKPQGVKYKRELVYILQAARMGECCKDICKCEVVEDLQKINVEDRPFYKQFWDMFRFWN